MLSNNLSNRSNHLIKESIFQSYISSHISLLNDVYDDTTNKNGGILMSVAENKLCSDIILNKLQNHSLLSLDVLHYSNITGTYELKTVLSSFLSTYVFKECLISIEHLIISSGCTALLTQLSYTLFEANDSILIPIPCYPVFDHDFYNIAQVHIKAIDFIDHNNNNEVNVNDLELAYHNALRQGIKYQPCFLSYFFYLQSSSTIVYRL